jgi:hypothetical protein
MAENRRRDAMTAGIGLSGVAGSGALRHLALEEAYGEKGPTPVKRPRFAAELRLVKHPPGRAKWLAGAGLGALSVPPAAVGTHRLFTRPDRPRKRRPRLPEPVDKADRQRRTLLQEGIEGVRESLSQRNESWSEKKPAKLVLGNYAAGLGVGSGASGLSHLAMRRSKLSGGKKAAIASVAGTTAGSLSLPLQSSLTRKLSRGRYEVTPNGVRRRKAAPVRPSAKAGTGGNVAKIAVRSSPALIRAGYHLPVKPSRAANVGARVGGHWTSRLVGASDLLEHYPAKHRPLHQARPAKLVKTGRGKAAEVVRAVAYDVSSLNDKDKLVRETAAGLYKRDTGDPGAGLSRAQRRMQVTAAGQVPILGNLTASAAAARLSPAPYRKRTALQQFAGSQGGDTAGSVAGAAGALALAHRYKGFDRAAQQAGNQVSGAKNAVRSAVGMKPAKAGPGRLTTALTEHPKVPKLVRTAAKHVARRPGVAAIGALAGGMIGGQLGQQGAYSAIMRRDDKYRNRAHNSNPSARHGTGKISKLAGKPLSQREKTQLAQRKRRNAAMMTFTGTTGLGALGATVGEKALRHRNPAVALRLKRVTVPLLTAGAGVGGINAFTGAKIQRREAASLSKAFGIPRVPTGAAFPTGVRRAKTMRRGFLRQTRTSTGAVRTTSVRGGLG